MDRDLLNHLPVLLAVARRKSFAAAAAELGMGPSAVSHSVKLVEDRIGVSLFARTTRSVSLTEAGAALIESVGPALQDINERVERIRAVKGRVSGLLRLNVPSVSLPMVVTPALAEMARRHPDVRVEAFIDDSMANIVAAGFDAGIRLGEMIAEDMVAVRLTPPMRAILVASPSYLAARGRPKSIADLKGHNCIAYRQISGGGLYRWELLDGGRDVAVDSLGSTIVNDALYACELARSGLGIAYVLEPLVRQDISTGRLRQVLPRTSIEEPGLFLYFPRRAEMAPKLRAFIDTAVRLGKRKRGSPT